MFKLIAYMTVILTVVFKIFNKRKNSSEHVKDIVSLNRSNKLKILTYNIQRLPYLFRKNIDIDFLLTKYDIICLQENFNNREIHRCNSISPACRWFKLVDSGLTIYSKHNIEFIDFIPFNNLSSVDRLSDKGFLIVKIKDIYLINTHLQSVYSEADDIITNNQLQTIFNRCKHLNKVLICGDFNIDLRLFSENNGYFKTIIPNKPTHWNKQYSLFNSNASPFDVNNSLTPYFYDGGFYKNISIDNIQTVQEDELTDHLGVSFNVLI